MFTEEELEEMRRADFQIEKEEKAMSMKGVKPPIVLGHPLRNINLCLAVDTNDVNVLVRMEEILLRQSLVAFEGNKTRVAKFLGVTPRTVRNKLKEFKIGRYDVTQSYH